MSILPHILTNVLGAAALLFLLWRRLKEDYSSELIFNAGFIVIISVLLSSGIFSLTSRFLPEREFLRPMGMWFWGGVVGILAGVKLSQIKFNIKFTETLEAAAIGILPWLFLVYAVEFALAENQIAGVLCLVVFSLFGLFYYLEGSYRRFSWYKSGKVGFSGLVTMMIYFVVRGIFSVQNNAVFSTVGRIDIILSGVLVFLLAFSLYNLSEAS